MTLRVRSEADIDYAESALYYITEETPESAERFTNEVERTYGLIRKSPKLGRIVEYGLRERRVKGIPFAVLNGIEETEIVVVAIYHDRRERVTLRERL